MTFYQHLHSTTCRWKLVRDHMITLYSEVMHNEELIILRYILL